MTITGPLVGVERTRPEAEIRPVEEVLVEVPRKRVMLLVLLPLLLG